MLKKNVTRSDQLYPAYFRCCRMAGYDSRTHTCKDGEIVEDECAAMGKPFWPESKWLKLDDYYKSKTALLH